jgi:hypothetical protein
MPGMPPQAPGMGNPIQGAQSMPQDPMQTLRMISQIQNPMVRSYAFHMFQQGQAAAQKEADIQARLAMQGEHLDTYRDMLRDRAQYRQTESDRREGRHTANIEYKREHDPIVEQGKTNRAFINAGSRGSSPEELAKIADTAGQLSAGPSKLIDPEGADAVGIQRYVSGLPRESLPLNKPVTIHGVDKRVVFYEKNDGGIGAEYYGR